MFPHPEPVKPSWRTLAWSAAYLLAVSAALYALFANWAYDDPFITYRYADNLARGLGFVYNPGERLLSTTSPLFALLLAAVKALGGEIHTSATLIGALSAACGGLCLWILGRTWQTPLVGWAGLLLYPGFALLGTTIGSETPLYLALCLGAFAAFARPHWTLTAILAALAVLTRPDGALVPLTLAAAFLLRPGMPKPALQNIPWKAVALFLALSAAWFLFAWAYFGSPIPLTLAAKQHQGAMVASQRFGPGFLTILANYNKPLYWVEAALAAAGLGVMLWKRSPWLVLLAWTGLYFAAFTLLGVSRYYWYYTPLLPGFIACLGIGLEALFQRLRRIPLGLLVLLPAALLIFQARDTWELHARPDPRYPIYRARRGVGCPTHLARSQHRHTGGGHDRLLRPPPDGGFCRSDPAGDRRPPGAYQHLSGSRPVGAGALRSRCSHPARRAVPAVRSRRSSPRLPTGAYPFRRNLRLQP